MAKNNSESTNDERRAHGQTAESRLNIQGQAELEGAETVPGDTKLRAYAFGPDGEVLGTGAVDREGRFTVPVRAEKPLDVEVVVGPSGADPQEVRESAYGEHFAAGEWVQEERGFVLRPQFYIPRPAWWPWRPIRICVDGVVQKVHTEDGHTETCPVPFVKVEIYDVDRESCWWPYIIRWWDVLIRRPVIRIPDLINPRFPPDPIGPVSRFVNPGVIRGFNPQPDPPGDLRLNPGLIHGFDPQPDPPTTRRRGRSGEMVSLNPQPEPPGVSRPGDEVSLNPQPLPPREALTGMEMSEAVSARALRAVGELRNLSPTNIAKLQDLTLTSQVAPWLIFPRCFYSTAKICETYTDCEGHFRCCFRWFPWHIRRGRLRFDSRPDIIVKVTQTINGVDRVIYMDPYTSTRWNVTTAHITLNLDDEHIVCGQGNCTDPLPGSQQASLLQVGGDPVWTINQADGMYTTATPFVNNAPYAGALYLFGNFSLDLKTFNAGTDKANFFYKISWAKEVTSGVTPPDAAFQAIQTPLSLQRAEFLGAFTDHLLGPQPSGPAAGLYEVQDSQHWWMMSGSLLVGGNTPLALWDTTAIELDEGTYILRMEVFNDAGVKLTTVQFPNHGGNGSGLDPNPPPVVTDHLDIKVALDNKPMTFSLTTPAVNPCGVVHWTPSLSLEFHVHADQVHNRVDSWTLRYVKGIDPTRRPTPADLPDPNNPTYPEWSATYPSGTGGLDATVNGQLMLEDPSSPSGQLESTCAFALLLNAWAHIRGNYGFIWYGELPYAIAIERCICPEPANS